MIDCVTFSPNLLSVPAVGSFNAMLCHIIRESGKWKQQSFHWPKVMLLNCVSEDIVKAVVILQRTVKLEQSGT